MINTVENRILQEQLLQEAFLDSIRDYAREKYNKVITTINDWKDLAVVMGKVASSGRILDRFSDDVWYNFRKNPLKKLIDFLKKIGLDSLISKIENVVNKITNLSGWKKFFAATGIGAMVKYVIEKMSGLGSDEIKNFIEKYISEKGLGEILSKLTDFKSYVGWLQPIIKGVEMLYDVLKDTINKFKDKTQLFTQNINLIRKENMSSKDKLKELLKTKLKQEISGTGTGASVTPGTGEGVATKYAFGKKANKGTPKDWKAAPSIPNRPSKAMDYKELWEGSDWPKEIPSRYADEFLFIHDDNKPGFYDVKDVATGKIVDRFGFRTPENAIYFAKDKIKPQGGTRSTQLENESSLEIDDRVKVVYGNEFYGETGTIVDIKRGFVTVEMDRNGNEYSMHISDVQKIDDEDDDYDDDILDETHINTEFNVNKVWDFIESIPFNNPNYMPKFNTAEEIWKQWGEEEKEMYSKFKWDNPHGSNVHPKEKAALRHQQNYNALAGLNENYARFRNETKTRSKPEQFHSAVKEVKKKVNEINRLFEYMNRLQSELKESEGGLKTKKYTENALQQIKEATKQLFFKSTKLK
jgi:ferritin